MKALLLAGGLGTRLRPLTEQLPKPMALVGNVPWLEHLILQLRDQGIREFVLALKHYPELIRRHLGNGSKYGVSIEYLIEQDALGTAGAIKNAEAHLGETFLVFNADTIQTMEIQPMLDYHQSRGAQVTIGLTEVDDPSAFGVVDCTDSGQVRRFIEKPKRGEAVSNRINAGIYVMNKEALRYIPEGREVSIERETFPLLIHQGIGVYGYTMKGYWMDMGTRERYRQVHRDLLDRKLNLRLPGTEREPGIWMGKGCRIGQAVRLIAPVLIGDHVRIEDHAVIGPYTILGDHCHIARGAQLAETILWNRSSVKDNAKLNQCVCGYDSLIESRHILYEAFAQRMKEEAVVG